MAFFYFILMVVAIGAIGGPLADGIGKRIARGGPDGADAQRLRKELEDLSQRLADTELRLRQAEDRLDFQEKLLTGRPEAPRLEP